jgi:homopolymeric O-antigen transport system ATP-binding protein
MPESVIRVRDLEKRYRVWAHAPPTNLKERLQVAGASLRARTGIGERQIFRHEVWALRGVSFDVGRGEVLGVIGRNGAGKSTLLSILARITQPSAGYAEIRGRVSSLLEVGTGFHPELTGRDNVFLNGAILGMPRSEIARKFDEIVEFSGIGEFIDIPVKRYSSGMQVRLAFAVGAQLDPEILLLDEVLAVGDAEFQAKCHARIREITEAGRTALFVSHDVGSVARICNEAIVLAEGRVAFRGPAEAAVEHYLLGSGTTGGALAEAVAGQPVRIRRVQATALDGSGELWSGEPTRIAVELDVATPVAAEDLRIDLTIARPSADPYVALSTAMVGMPASAPAIFEGPATLVCETESLALKPGTYTIAATVNVAGVRAHHVERAAELKLLATNFFSSTAAQTTYPAPFLVRHMWSVAAKTAGELGRRPRGEVSTSRP